MSALGRWCMTCICTLLVAALSSCGRVAPRFSPLPPPGTGTLIVTSVPDGAAILLDGLATGRFTPDTLRDLAAGPHVVRVRRDGWTAEPESVQVDLAPQAIEQAAFTLTLLEAAPSQVVVLEAFSNVNCVGCPQLAATLRALMAEPGYGPDRVVLVKYAANWPAVSDPHYQANPADNVARMTFYQPYLAVGIPTLIANGALAGASGQPPALEALRDQVDGLLQGDPGFAIRVEAVALPGGTSISATATLHAERLVSHANTVLQFALVQDPVNYPTPPGNQGETEFHWIMRDLAAATQPPLPLAAEETALLETTLARQAAWPVADLHVIAFVQDALTRQIFQAAHAIVTTQATRAVVTAETVRPVVTNDAVHAVATTAPARAIPASTPMGRSARPLSRGLNRRGRP
jgi:hypothetical protein